MIVCVVLNWFGDSMDGTLARVRRQQRPRYGFYVDHMVDVFGSVALMCGLGVLGTGALAGGDCDAGGVPAAVERELSGDVYACRSFQLSQGIFGPTEIRLLLIAGEPGAAAQSVRDDRWASVVAV